MAENGLEHALKAIDPVARAMLDLSIRRRLPDSSIADLAQMPPDELVRWRGEVLDQLATQIGLTGPNARDEVRARLEAIDPSAWVTAAAKRPAKAEKPAEGAAAATHKPRRERPSRRLLWLLALLVALVAIVAIISLSGDDSGDSSTPPPPPTTSTTTTKPTTSSSTTTTTTKPTSTTSTTPSTPPGPKATMDPLPGMPDHGTATATVTGSGNGRTVTVALEGLPAPGGGSGVYELWLYNSLIGAQPLGTASSGNATITSRLPDDANRFRYLDLSRESGPNDRVHSGISVRRTALAPLLSGNG
jgi:hypothetical protein